MKNKGLIERYLKVAFPIALTFGVAVGGIRSHTKLSEKPEIVSDHFFPYEVDAIYNLVAYRNGYFNSKEESKNLEE